MVVVVVFEFVVAVLVVVCYSVIQLFTMEVNNFASPTYNEYKTRNILSLEERVEVIREYDRHLTRPSLQSLAQKFECSSKQIKNIILNRETILQSYKSSGGSTPRDVAVRDDVLQKRQEKINFLGKVIYEYVQRALYYNYNIDNEKVRRKALQVKECIAVENFQPTIAWLMDFKRTYGIPSFDLQSLRNNVVITEAKRPHFSPIDMIQYVSRMEQEHNGGGNNFHNDEEDGSGRITIPKADINGNGRSDYASNNNSNKQQPPAHEPKIIYEIEDEEEDEELRKLNFADDESSNSTSLNEKYAVKRKASSSPFPDIETVDEALRHLKSLEEYAMLQDNYRAIGLLTQLEEIFKKQAKKK